jgi:hypothetical protein
MCQFALLGSVVLYSRLTLPIAVSFTAEKRESVAAALDNYERALYTQSAYYLSNSFLAGRCPLLVFRRVPG